MHAHMHTCIHACTHTCMDIFTVPDDMVMQMLSRRLCQLECAVRGYVLHGFPLNRDQAELMMTNGHKPNRVFFLNIPEDSIKERLALKRVDPLTGERWVDMGRESKLIIEGLRSKVG